MAVFVVIIIVLLIVIGALWARHNTLKREAYVRNFEFPRGLFEGLRKKRPALSLKECQLTAQALRQFFIAYNKSGHKYVSMPSQLADDLWHEFILYTRYYEKFCQQAFGRFLHHTPAAVLGSDKKSNEGLRRTWYYCCLQENINPRNPTRLPLLFALDAKMNIADGFRYAPDCKNLRANDGAAAASSVVVVHCGGDFSSPSIDGGTDGFGSSSSSDSGWGGSGSDSGGGGDGGGGGCGGGGCGS
jgi:hypothetical protein